MTELYPSDPELNALSGTTDSEQEVPFLAIGESPYHTSFYKMLHRLLNVARRAGDLRVYKDGPLTFGLRAGSFADGATVHAVPASQGNALDDNTTNYIYLRADGTLTVNAEGFPIAGDTPHVPLAAIVTLNGEYRLADITDFRGGALFRTLRNAGDEAIWGRISGTLTDQADLSEALSDKEPALPTAAAAGYLHDDGEGNRSWSAMSGGEWSRLDNLLSPSQATDRVLLGTAEDDGTSVLQVGGNARLAGLLSGGTFDSFFTNTIDVSFNQFNPFIRMSLGANLDNPGHVNFQTVPIVGEASDIFFQPQPPTPDGYVYWEAYQCAGLIVGTTDDKPILFKTNRQLPAIATIRSGGVEIAGNLSATAAVTFSGLPTSDPGEAGQLWNDSGTIRISSGG